MKTTRQNAGLGGAHSNGTNGKNGSDGKNPIFGIFGRRHLDAEPAQNGQLAQNGVAYTIQSRIERKEKKAERLAQRAGGAWRNFMGALMKPLEPQLDRLFVKSAWIAGAHAPKAADRAMELNRRGSSAILCCLGEHCQTEAQAHEMVLEYRPLILQVGERKIDASIAVRPSPFGSDAKDLRGMTQEEHAWRNLDFIVAKAKKNGVLVWLDMEDSGYTDYTLEIYRDFRRRYGNVGIVLQANLKRSAQDMRDVLQDAEFAGKPPVLRLVRGIYRESGRHAIEGRQEIHENFAELIRIAFKEAPTGATIAVATHHEARILEALRLAEARKDVILELQVLKGIKTELADALRRAGYAVTEYVPYGKHPFAYSMRRFGESPQFGEMVLKELLGGWPPLAQKYFFIPLAKLAYFARFGQWLSISHESGEDAGTRRELAAFIAQKPESANAQSAR